MALSTRSLQVCQGGLEYLKVLRFRHARKLERTHSILIDLCLSLPDEQWI